MFEFVIFVYLFKFMLPFIVVLSIISFVKRRKREQQEDMYNAARKAYEDIKREEEQTQNRND